MQYQLQRIIDISDRLVEKYGTRDPFEIADCLNLVVVLSNELVDLKGIYIYYKEIKIGCLSVNASLDDCLKKVVCAHEIGHDRPHRSICNGFFPESDTHTLFLKTEYEANLFPANLLISDDEFLDCAQLGMTRLMMASELDTDPNMIDFKAEILKAKGYNINLQNHCTLFLK